jgi:AcrR family transcriptional regulator
MIAPLGSRARVVRVRDVPSPKRSYRMGARADAKAATRERILDAAGKRLAPGGGGEDPSLEDIAADAGTTVQTVLRHFGSKDGLLEAILHQLSELARRERSKVPPGDVPAAAKNLVRHYERYGDAVMRVLAEEQRRPVLRRFTDRGRQVHYEWVERTFEPQLGQLSGQARARRRAQLVAVCDVYTWKLLRRDMKLGARETELALIELIEGLRGA